MQDRKHQCHEPHGRRCDIDGAHIEFVPANGLRFEVAMCGDGAKLALCLHGFPESYYSWRHQMPLLARLGYTVWAPNMRGYGRSSRPGQISDYAIANLLQDIAGLIDAAGKKSTVLIGHDWSGTLSWLFAQRQLRPLERIIILNAPHPKRMIDCMMLWPQLLKIWYIFFFQIPWLPEFLLGRHGARAIGDVIRNSSMDRARFPDAVLDVYRRNASEPGALTAMLNWYRAFLRQRLSVRERANMSKPIEIPALLIWGERDIVLEKSLTYDLEKLVPHLTLHYLTNVSHWLQQEAPEEVNAIIEAWLTDPREIRTFLTAK